MADRVTEITFKGTVENRDDATPLLKRPGDTVMVVRGAPRMLVMKCPSGCGDNLIINLDRRTGYAWRLYQRRKDLTLYPSYWREDGCRSHFIVWNSHIYWCHGWESDESESWSVSSAIEDVVLSALPSSEFINYETLAERLELVPWETLQACRQLVTQGKAVSGKKEKNVTNFVNSLKPVVQFRIQSSFKSTCKCIEGCKAR